MKPDTQNTAGTDGETGLTQVAQVPAGPDRGGTAGYVLVPRRATKAMLDAAYATHDAYEAAETGGWGGLGSVYAAMIAAAPQLNPVPVAAALEAAAEAAGKDAVWCSSDERAVAQVQRASTYRRLAAVLREPGFGEVRS